jgi:hypothetical protein
MAQTKKPLSLALVISIIGLAAAQAMPLAPPVPTQAGLTILIAEGCGVGKHRGPNGECRRNGYYGGYYYGRRGPSCGDRGWLRVCNDFGRCWRVCK